MSNGPTFPHRNYDFTRRQVDRLQHEGDEWMRKRARTPEQSAHSTHRGAQTRHNDRPDRPGDGVGGNEPTDMFQLFADDY